MNKQEAAQFLDCSVRAVERYVQQGKISVRYEKGKTRSVASFDEVELERFKEELERSLIKPAFDEPRQMSPEPQLELAIFNDERGEVVGVDEIDRLSSIIELLLKGQSVRVADKLLLTIHEAQELTGLSREYLKDAIASGSLKSKKIGKPWRIKKTDLDSFIENL
jgi:excisionase family DNA binding protein